MKYLEKILVGFTLYIHFNIYCNPTSSEDLAMPFEETPM